MNYNVLLIEPIKDMLGRVGGFIPTLIITLGILIAGTFVTVLLTKVVSELLKAIHFDKVADKIGISGTLKNGGVKLKPSELLTTLTYWVMIVTVFIMTIKAYGLTFATDLLDSILAYIPSVISGALVLIVGMIVARIVAGLIHVVATVTDMPKPELVGRLSKYAILGYTSIVFIKEIGLLALFEGSYTTFMMGVVFALALAFGLAGKDVAARFLDSLRG